MPDVAVLISLLVPLVVECIGNGLVTEFQKVEDLCESPEYGDDSNENSRLLRIVENEETTPIIISSTSMCVRKIASFTRTPRWGMLIFSIIARK